MKRSSDAKQSKVTAHVQMEAILSGSKSELMRSPILELPFFIQWLTADHPSHDGKAVAAIEKITIADTDHLADSWFKEEILASLGDVNIEWVDPASNDGDSGIVAVHLSTPSGVVVLD